MEFKDHIVHVEALKHLGEGFTCWFRENVMIPIAAYYNLIAFFQPFTQLGLEIFQHCFPRFSIVISVIEVLDVLLVH